MRKQVIANYELAEMICDFAGAQPGTQLEAKLKAALERIRKGAMQYEPVSLTDAARLAVKVFEQTEKY